MVLQNVKGLVIGHRSSFDEIDFDPLFSSDSDHRPRLFPLAIRAMKTPMEISEGIDMEAICPHGYAANDNRSIS